MKKIKLLLINLFVIVSLSISFTGCSDPVKEEENESSKITSSDVKAELFSDISLNYKNESNTIVIGKPITNDEELFEALNSTYMACEDYITHSDIKPSSEENVKPSEPEESETPTNQIITFYENIMNNIMQDEVFIEEVKEYMETGKIPTKSKILKEEISYKDLSISESADIIDETINLLSEGRKGFKLPKDYQPYKEAVDKYAKLNKFYVNVDGAYTGNSGDIKLKNDIAVAFEVENINSLLGELEVTSSSEYNFPLQYLSVLCGFMSEMDSSAKLIYETVEDTNESTMKNLFDDINAAMVLQVKANIQNENGYGGYLSAEVSLELDKDLYLKMINDNDFDPTKDLDDNVKINITVSDNEKVTYRKNFTIDEFYTTFIN